MTGEAPMGGRWEQTPWGLPDWWDAESYNCPEPGNLGEWDESRWRWEFLRRRGDYRADFEAALAAQPDPLALPADITPEEAGWLIGDGMRAWPFTHPGAQRFGLTQFFDPVISEWGVGGPEWNSGIEYGGGHGEEWVVAPDGGFAHAPAEHRFAISFDLRRPLNAQLAAAREMLQQAQFDYFAYGEGARDGLGPVEAEKRAFRMPAASKVHRTKWLLYLRAIDAREADAILSEIAEILPPHHGRRDAKAAHNVVEQARALQFRF